MIIDIGVRTHFPPRWARAGTVVIIVLVVVRWLPHLAVPLGLGGWLGSWASAPGRQLGPCPATALGCA